jgi:hypothetical protein
VTCGPPIRWAKALKKSAPKAHNAKLVTHLETAQTASLQ